MMMFVLKVANASMGLKSIRYLFEMILILLTKPSDLVHLFVVTITTM